MPRCTFITLSNKVCAKITVANHEHCRFHSSILERERHRLITPRWVLKIIPKQADSHCHFNAFPKDNYDYYDDDTFEPGLQPYTMFKSTKHTAVMPELKCRFMLTIGRFKGYYCDHPNETGSDFCCFHRSVIEVPDTEDYPVPMWTQCIHPTEVHSRLPMFTFPWKDYNIMELLFLDLITAPIPTDNPPPNSEKITSITAPIDPSTVSPKITSVSKEPIKGPSQSTPCTKVHLSNRMMSQKRSTKQMKRMKHRERTLYYECPGECQQPGCNCKVITVPMQVIDFEPRQNLYREIAHGYIVKEANGLVMIQGIFDTNSKKMRSLTDEEKEHALEHGMTVI